MRNDADIWAERCGLLIAFGLMTISMQALFSADRPPASSPNRQVAAGLSLAWRRGRPRTRVWCDTPCGLTTNACSSEGRAHHKYLPAGPDVRNQTRRRRRIRGVRSRIPGAHAPDAPGRRDLCREHRAVAPLQHLGPLCLITWALRESMVLEFIRLRSAAPNAFKTQRR